MESLLQNNIFLYDGRFKKKGWLGFPVSRQVWSLGAAL
jgi:hypothetical protein